MISRFVRFCAVLSAAALVSESLAQNPPAAPTSAPASSPSALRPAPPEDELVSLTLGDADIDTVLDVLRQYTGREILRPQALQIAPNAAFPLKITRKIPKAEAILAIETILSLNNVAIAPLGDRYIKVVDAAKIKQEAPEMIKGSAFDYPASGKIATKLFQLEFARITDVIPLLGGLVSVFYGGPIPLQNANATLITDTISNLQRVELLLQQVDRPIMSGMKPKFYGPLRNAKASDVVNKLRTILTGTLQAQVGTATSYNADDRTNQIILVTDPRQHGFFDDLIDKLDQKSDPNTRTEVIYLKNAKAEDVVTLMGNIITKQTAAIKQQSPGSVRPGQVNQPMGPIPPATPPQPNAPVVASSPNPTADAQGTNEFSGVMTVVNDNRSNAVVVFGTADDIRLAHQLIDQLDIVLSQVRIECVIAEVTLDDNDASGISALGLKIEGDKLVGFSGALAGTEQAAAAITNGTLVRPGPVTGGMDLAFELAINSNLRKRNNSIVTVPAIATSHGKKAEFFNGETRPIVTGSITSGTVGGTTSTTQQQEIGTTLTVTPFIGSDNSVQLELITDVKNVTGEVLVDQNKQYIIGSRRTNSYVTAKSGDIIVLSGFRKDTEIRERGRLGPIPIIGDIFGPRTKNRGRQELIFFVRPIVLTNNSTVDNAAALKRIEQMSNRDAVKSELDPSFQPAPKSTLDKILGK